MAVLHLLLCVVVCSFEVELKRVKSPFASRWDRSEAKEVTSLFYSPLLNYVNMQYTGQLCFGTPAQCFALVFDTGSSWTWVNDVQCGSYCSLSGGFEASLSSSYVKGDSRLILQYGRGTAEGFFASETVRLSPTDGIVNNQTVLLVDYTEDMEGVQAHGILGLAFARLSDGYPTFVDNLKAQGQVKDGLFAFYLSDKKQPEKGEVSSISFGSYDLNRYALSGLTYLKAFSSTGYWAVSITGFSIEEKSYWSTGGAIIDSGTSLLIIPLEPFELLTESICQKFKCIPNASSFLIFSCKQKDISSLPQLGFHLGGHKFSLPPEAYVEFYPEDGGVCITLVQPMNLGLWILGDVFMRRYYSVFDMDNSRIGLALSINNPKVSNGGKWMWLGISVGFMACAVAIGVILGDDRKKEHTLEDPLLQPLDRRS